MPYMGMGCPQTQPDDRICVLIGCRSPVILREVGENEHIIIGDFYDCSLLSYESPEERVLAECRDGLNVLETYKLR